MTRARGPKICAYCNKTITYRYPPYLIDDGTGQISGPYHAGCAARLLKLIREGKKDPGVGHVHVYGLATPAPQETLLW